MSDPIRIASHPIAMSLESLYGRTSAQESQTRSAPIGRCWAIVLTDRAASFPSFRTKRTFAGAVSLQICLPTNLLHSRALRRHHNLLVALLYHPPHSQVEVPLCNQLHVPHYSQMQSLPGNRLFNQQVPLSHRRHFNRSACRPIDPPHHPHFSHQLNRPIDHICSLLSNLLLNRLLNNLRSCRCSQ